ncbi:MAG TPA: multicopper oxidase family protein [Burkholderiales bacterium]|nr:multicopper oxidase family protein [Burkholderiales bacterium]
MFGAAFAEKVLIEHDGGRPFWARRRFLTGFAGLAAAPLLSRSAGSAPGANSKLVEAHLAARAGRTQLVPAEYPATDVWAYNGSVPGPVLHVSQGDRLRVRVDNALSEGTTVHWHGVRVPNAMDGVPLITQPPIAPGGEFIYEFVPPDAGTFFYHPHQRSYEQVGRGLAGALIVDEREPPKVDRDLLWVLGDWRLNRDASIRGGFGSFMDASHNGRVGNTVTINGRVPNEFLARAGERIRLRLVNAATARVFGLAFGGHRPWIVALDGQPVEPHEPEQGVIVLGPAMRADLILDMAAAPGSRHSVRDGFYRSLEYELLKIAYGNEPPLRKRAEDPFRLPANPLSEPTIQNAERHDVLFTGGMMGNMSAMRRGMAWAVNGTSGSCGEGTSAFDPLFVLRKGRSYVLNLVNDTAWHHPIHLHGHSFRVITRNGRPAKYREWLDTVLLPPREQAEIAFVADNPGDWMFHCHVLEHQAGGMMACIRVT